MNEDASTTCTRTIAVGHAYVPQCRADVTVLSENCLSRQQQDATQGRQNTGLLRSRAYLTVLSQSAAKLAKSEKPTAPTPSPADA